MEIRSAYNPRNMDMYGIRIFVFSLDTALHFYRDLLGLQLSVSNPHFLQFECGAARLMVEPVSHKEYEHLVGRFTGISFTVTNIENETERLKQLGITFTGDPEAQHWGGALATFSDSAGNELQLVQMQYP